MRNSAAVVSITQRQKPGTRKTVKTAPKRDQKLSKLMTTYRAKKDKTLDEMAELTKLAKSTLWEMENDWQIDPRLSTLQSVCKHYGFAISRVANYKKGAKKAKKA